MIDEMERTDGAERENKVDLSGTAKESYEKLKQGKDVVDGNISDGDSKLDKVAEYLNNCAAVVQTRDWNHLPTVLTSFGTAHAYNTAESHTYYDQLNGVSASYGEARTGTYTIAGGLEDAQRVAVRTQEQDPQSDVAAKNLHDTATRVIEQTGSVAGTLSLMVGQLSDQHARTYLQQLATEAQNALQHSLPHADELVNDFLTGILREMQRIEDVQKNRRGLAGQNQELGTGLADLDEAAKELKAFKNMPRTFQSAESQPQTHQVSTQKTGVATILRGADIPVDTSPTVQPKAPNEQPGQSTADSIADILKGL